MSNLLVVIRVAVGLMFVWTGAIKGLSPGTFGKHLRSLGLIPDWLVPSAVSFVVSAETGIGVALFLGFSPRIVFGLTIFLLIVLSAISWWGVNSGRASDCGCYGGVVSPSIAQSLAINGLLVATSLVGFLLSADRPARSWEAATALMLAIAALLATEVSQWYERLTGKPAIDLSPLKLGSRWRHRWAGGATRNLKGEVLVTFMGPDCPYCVKWVAVANAMSQSSQLPPVVGVMATSSEKLESFREVKGIRFPLVNISASVLNRLVQAVPTTVLIESGRIRQIWAGDMPSDFVDRFRDAFFPGIGPVHAPREP